MPTCSRPKDIWIYEVRLTIYDLEVRRLRRAEVQDAARPALHTRGYLLIRRVNDSKASPQAWIYDLRGTIYDLEVRRLRRAEVQDAARPFPPHAGSLQTQLVNARQASPSAWHTSNISKTTAKQVSVAKREDGLHLEDHGEASERSETRRRAASRRLRRSK